jgi:ABC-type transport system involved in multi-copper enzyme maturation permease subunit
MRAVATLLLDSVRVMRARVLFWVVLGISALVGLVYLSVGFNDSGFSMLFGLLEFDHPTIRAGTDEAELVYLGLFQKFIVIFWLFGAAVFLAIIATASIYPDLMAEGSIEVTLSKPVGRLRLFLIKYVGSLLFMAVQVGIFMLLVFFAMRWRVGTWNPSLFWFVPLAVLVFSYLYCVVVLFSVKTRSVLPGILGAAALWVLAFIFNMGDALLYQKAYPAKNMIYAEEEIASLEGYRNVHRAVYAINAFLPKPRQTLDLSDRLVVVNGARGFSTTDFVNVAFGSFVHADGTEDRLMRRNSAGYVLGTSLAFEAVLVGLAAWIFCRRDF